MSLAQLLDQPGTLVMVDVGPASVPASTLSIGADDVPTLTPTPIFTATPTPLPAPSPTATAPSMETGTPALPCHGDCNDDGEVTVDEIVRGVNIALEVLPVDACSILDADNDGKVTIGEIIAAVNSALNGCVSG